MVTSFANLKKRSGSRWRLGFVCSSLCLLLTSLTAGEVKPWLDIPYVQQKKAACGSAAIAMVVQYWAREQPNLESAASDSEEIDRLLPASAKGIQGRALKAFLEGHGFDAYIFDGE